MTKEKIREYSLGIAETISDKKGRDVIVIDVEEVTPLFDYMVIATADSQLHLNALMGFVEDKMDQLDINRVNRKNLFADSPWILIDCGFIVVHLFNKEARDFYSIEKLWADGKVIFNDSPVGVIN